MLGNGRRHDGGVMDTPPINSVNISDQIKCVERELKYRRRVYPRRISLNQMTQRLADTQIEHMEAVLATLNEVLAKQEFSLT